MADDVLVKDNIELGVELDSQDEAIRRAGELLVQNGYVEEKYIDSMFEREKSVSTFMGNAVAIPHGTSDSKQWVENPVSLSLRSPKAWTTATAKSLC